RRHTRWPRDWSSDVCSSDLNTTANGIPARWVTDIEVKPDDAGTAYATVSGFGTGHVFKTTNSGALWANVSGNLPDAPVNAVAVEIGRASCRERGEVAVVAVE